MILLLYIVSSQELWTKWKGDYCKQKTIQWKNNAYKELCLKLQEKNWKQGLIQRGSNLIFKSSLPQLLFLYALKTNMCMFDQISSEWS